MNRKWEAHTNLRDGLSRIVFEDGEELTVKNDGVTGFAFVEEYLEEMRKNYPSHLEACDIKLRMRLGRSYKTIREIKRRYMAELALISLNCCFGGRTTSPTTRDRTISTRNLVSVRSATTVRSTDSILHTATRSRCAATRFMNAG